MVNLDGMDSDELGAFAASTDNYLLADYARWKGCAILNRRKGNIEIALKCEKQCERVYDELSDCDRW